jgi:integrase
MSIKKLTTGKWLVKVHLRKPKDVQKQRIVSGKKSDAKAAEEQLKKEIRENSGLNQPEILPESSLKKTMIYSTFGEALSLYEETKDISHSKSVFKILREKLGHVFLTDIGTEFFKYWKECKKQFKNPTCNRRREWAIAVINLVLQKSRMSKEPICEIEKNPIEWIPKLPEEPRDRVLTQEERIKFIDALESEAPHLLPLFQYASLVPCRTKELTGMKRENLDLIQNKILVPKRNIKGKKTGGIWKPIPPSMVSYFRNLPTETEFLFYRVQTGRKDLKTGKYDRRNFKYLQIINFYKSWNRCLEKAEIENFRLHDCRHQSATALINAGTPERVVRAIANWKTDMLRIYYHIEPADYLKEVKFEENEKCDGKCDGTGTNG